MPSPELGSTPSYAVIFAVVSFVLSVGAACLAVNLYSLLRTGRMGASWRVLIIAAVIFALLQATRLYEVVSPMAADIRLSSVIELIFILALAYAFYLQRCVFTEHSHLFDKEDEVERERSTDSEPIAVSAYENYS